MWWRLKVPVLMDVITRRRRVPSQRRACPHASSFRHGQGRSSRRQAPHGPRPCPIPRASMRQACRSRPQAPHRASSCRHGRDRSSRRRGPLRASSCHRDRRRSSRQRACQDASSKLLRGPNSQLAPRHASSYRHGLHRSSRRQAHRASKQRRGPSFRRALRHASMRQHDPSQQRVCRPARMSGGMRRELVVVVSSLVGRECDGARWW